MASLKSDTGQHLQFWRCFVKSIDVTHLLVERRRRAGRRKIQAIIFIFARMQLTLCSSHRQHNRLCSKLVFLAIKLAQQTIVCVEIIHSSVQKAGGASKFSLSFSNFESTIDKLSITCFLHFQTVVSLTTYDRCDQSW